MSEPRIKWRIQGEDQQMPDPTTEEWHAFQTWRLDRQTAQALKNDHAKQQRRYEKTQREIWETTGRVNAPTEVAQALAERLNVTEKFAQHLVQHYCQCYLVASESYGDCEIDWQHCYFWTHFDNKVP